MSTPKVVALGMAGAAGTLLIGQVLPWAAALQRGGPAPKVHFWSLFGGAVVTVVALSLGGFLACVGDPSEPRDAVAYGVTWQTAFAGLTGTLQARRTSSRADD
jgi:hypothetical protein